jgi:nucleotide-binding universal stress UspA family protein
MLFPESGPSDSIIDRFEKEADQRANLFVTKIIEHAQTAAIQAEAVCQKTDYVWKGIIETATAHHCDLIFMASHGRRGLANLLLGSETMKVLTHSSIAVLVYR